MGEQPTTGRPRRLRDYAPNRSNGSAMSAALPLTETPTGPVPVPPSPPTRTPLGASGTRISAAGSLRSYPPAPAAQRQTVALPIETSSGEPRSSVAIPTPPSSPGQTIMLPEVTQRVELASLEHAPGGTTTTLIIAGRERAHRPRREHRRRPVMMHLAVITLVVCVGLGVLYTVSPIGEAASHFAPFASLQSALDFAVPSAPRGIATTTYKVQAGDTPASIAAKFHTSVNTILGLNQLTAGDDLYAGEVLRVPAPPTPTPVPQWSQPAPPVYGYGPNRNASEAIAWAEAQLGSQNWDFYCQRFVENAYGTSDRYLTAQDAYYALHTSNSWTPDIGALVWFAPNAGNQWDGHVGIYIGDGNFISATSNGVAIDSLAYWNQVIAPYEGWGNPPPWW